MPVNDPALVRDQYATERNLRARQDLYEETEGDDPRNVAWAAIAAGRPRRVLEVGGGPGELAARVARELGASVDYVDLSPRMVELARERGIAKAQVGDVQDLPFADDSFDTAIAAWMLYHVPDVDRGLAELARVLERSGRLVAVTNSLDSLKELRDVIGWRQSDVASVFSRENGAALLRRHFAEVRQHDVDRRIVVRRREQVVAYRNSLTGADALPPVPAFDLPLCIRSATSVFVATK
jgi:SAM-dependent methyltransferase